MKDQFSKLDLFYQWVANHSPDRFIWFCIIRGWARHQNITKNNKLLTQVLVYELLNRLKQEYEKEKE